MLEIGEILHKFGVASPEDWLINPWKGVTSLRGFTFKNIWTTPHSVSRPRYTAFHHTYLQIHSAFFLPTVLYLFLHKVYWPKMLFGNLSLIPVVLTALFIYLLGWIIYCRYFHPLSSIPGPFLASFSRIWIVLKTMTGDIEHTQRALHRKHGQRCY